MQLTKVQIHNYRSILDESFDVYDYNLLIGANNAGKSTVINAIRTFYEDDKLKFVDERDYPKCLKSNDDNEDSWVGLTFKLSDEEYQLVDDKYKNNDKLLVLRRIFRGERFKVSQSSNIFAVIDGELEENTFNNSKNINSANIGEIIYIPAVSKADDNLKTTGTSPLKKMLDFVFKEATKAEKDGERLLQNLDKAFKEFNIYAKSSNGFITKILSSVNEPIKDWGLKFDLDIKGVEVEDIIKTLISHCIYDECFEEKGIELSQCGSGYQRSLIFQLICTSASFKELKESKKNEFKPDFTLILFEEPEAFLHPAQQNQMADNLRKLVDKNKHTQVILTSHSSHFISNSTDDFHKIVRLQKEDGITQVYQLNKIKLQDLYSSTKELYDYVKGVSKQITDKEQLISIDKFLKNEVSLDQSYQEEVFRYQLYLDAERSSMFFADYVILVEGHSDKAFYNYLFNTSWNDIKDNKIYILDAFEKYNIHKFMKFLSFFGIRHSVIFDTDEHNKNVSSLLNEFIEQESTLFTDEIIKIPENLERFLQIGDKTKNKDHKKALIILYLLENKKINQEKINELRSIIEYKIFKKQVNNFLQLLQK